LTAWAETTPSIRSTSSDEAAHTELQAPTTTSMAAANIRALDKPPTRILAMRRDALKVEIVPNKLCNI
jgi:hypothetical protein